MATNHEITITQNEGFTPKMDDMQVGDTVHFSSPDQGTLTVTFDAALGSPFLEPSTGQVKMVVLNSDAPLQLQKPGDFQCKCSLTRDGQTIWGWSPDQPQLGGDPHVRP